MLLLTAGCTTAGGASGVPGGRAPASGGSPATASPAATAVPAANGQPTGLAFLRGAAPAQFVALSYERSLQGPANIRGLGVFLADAATGAVARQLLPGTWDGMQAAGVATDRAGDVWVTYSEGPRQGPLSGMAGGDPLPHTCANAVVILRAHATPRESVYLRTGDNVLIGQAVPSPDGKLLAYTEAGCSTSPNGQYLRVTDVATGRSWTIGKGLPGCHIFTSPAWSADGTRLLEGYAAANLPYLNRGGICTGPQTERLLVLDARTPQPAAQGQVTSPDGNCQVTAAAGLAGGGVLVMEGCGRSADYAKDFAGLLLVGPDGRPQHRMELAGCTEAGPLAADPSGGAVLVTDGVDCDPTSVSARESAQLWAYSGGRLRLITGSLSPYRFGISQLAW
jgi:hypothetical protein